MALKIKVNIGESFCVGQSVLMLEKKAGSEISILIDSPRELDVKRLGAIKWEKIKGSLKFMNVEK